MKIANGLILFTLFLFLSGCDNSQSTSESEGEAAHSHEIESIDAVVTELKGYRDEIKEAFAAGTPGDCDDALHESVHVLKALPDSDPVTSLSEEDQADIKAATDELFAALNTIHDGFHGSSDVESNVYDSVAEKIDNAIDAIASKAPAPAQP